MKIAVLSGKGGTGKTTIATSLASGFNMNYVDCDVEEPNGYIFLKPEIEIEKTVSIPVPEFDSEKCTLCNRCVEVCQFNALAKTLDKIMLFTDLCHGCGACTIACNFDAITEVDRPIGIVEIGKYKNGSFISGKLNIKEPMGGPIISNLKKELSNDITLIDCPPGTSCSVVAAVEDTDFALLVTEPTKFGLHDLKLAVQLVKDMKIPLGVVVNRSHSNSDMISEYCIAENVDIIGRVPYSRKAAENYSRGNLLIENEEYKNIFTDIYNKLMSKLGGI